MLFLYWAWISKTFKELNINLSNSPDWTFWRDFALSYAAQSYVLSKSSYWMILGLCFAWKTFKTVNVNLLKSEKPFS